MTIPKATPTTARYVFDLDSDVDDQLTTLHANDKFLVADVSEVGNPNRTATLSALKTYFEFKISNIPSTITGDNVRDHDLMVLADMSETGMPFKTITIAELKKIFGDATPPPPPVDPGFQTRRPPVPSTSMVSFPGNDLTVVLKKGSTLISPPVLDKTATSERVGPSGITYSASLLPSFLTVRSGPGNGIETGRISLASAIPANVPSTFYFLWNANDGTETASQVVSVAVNPADPLLTWNVDAGTNTGNHYNAFLNTGTTLYYGGRPVLTSVNPLLYAARSRRAGATVSYSISTLPSWLSVNTTTRRLWANSAPQSTQIVDLIWSATDGTETISRGIYIHVLTRP